MLNSHLNDLVGEKEQIPLVFPPCFAFFWVCINATILAHMCKVQMYQYHLEPKNIRQGFNKGCETVNQSHKGSIGEELNTMLHSNCPLILAHLKRQSGDYFWDSFGAIRQHIDIRLKQKHPQS